MPPGAVFRREISLNGRARYAAGYQASFKDDASIVPRLPFKSAFYNCEKTVERDVEAYRKEA